jgi:hypothetical protein
MKYLYRVEGLLKLHRDIFQDEDFKEKYRGRNSSEEYALNIVAEDVETAIVRYRNEARQGFTIKDVGDDGPFIQDVAEITIREVTKLNYVDV